MKKKKLLPLCKEGKNTNYPETYFKGIIGFPHNK